MPSPTTRVVREASESGPRRVLELDRHGAELTTLCWNDGGGLSHAWIKITDESWVMIEPRAAYRPPWGLCDRLWHASDPAAGAQTPPDQLLRKVSGPYDITVSARPPRPVEGLGGPRFSVAVLAVQGGAPVTDAVVVIALRRPDGTEAGQVALTPNPARPQLHEARLTLPEVGSWSWTVAVTSPLGLESVEGVIEVVPGPAAGRVGTIAWAVVVAVLIAGGLLAWRSLRPRRREAS